jgi:hypothetical protein
MPRIEKDENMAEYDLELAYKHITEGIANAENDCWLDPGMASHACDVYLLDPMLNEGDTFTGTYEDEIFLITRVSGFMMNRAEKSNPLEIEDDLIAQFMLED